MSGASTSGELANLSSEDMVDEEQRIAVDWKQRRKKLVWWTGELLSAKYVVRLLSVLVSRQRRRRVHEACLTRCEPLWRTDEFEQ